jgi:hypothetical protein
MACIGNDAISYTSSSDKISELRLLRSFDKISELPCAPARHLEHQFHALVSRPSMQDPPSLPEPSKPCWKKSARMTCRQGGMQGGRARVERLAAGGR